MLHAKFKDHRTFDSGEDFKVLTINGLGGHLGHVTLTIYTNFGSTSQGGSNIKFGFIRPNGF